MAAHFIKRGASGANAMDKASKAAKAGGSGDSRFWLKDGAEAQITFLDGRLDEAGMLDCAIFSEHNVKGPDGKYGHCFMCTEESEPCPLCQQGDKPSVCAAFTVLNHTGYTDGDNKAHQNYKQLFVCKHVTYGALTKRAEKRGGLVGCTFDVRRIGGDKSARVGDDFDFVERLPGFGALMQKYGLTADQVKPHNYDEMLKYHTAAELRAMGFGHGAPVGAGQSQKQTAPQQQAAPQQEAPADDGWGGQGGDQQFPGEEASSAGNAPEQNTVTGGDDGWGNHPESSGPDNYDDQL